MNSSSVEPAPTAAPGDQAGALEVSDVTVRFAGLTALDGVSLTAAQRQVTGIIGPNGAGKTTLLKLLTGELAPDSGKVTRAKTLSGIVIDQQRKLMEPQRRVKDVLANGGDWIDVRGHKKHIKGYLKEFLFDPAIADAPIGSLSGGIPHGIVARPRRRNH